MLAKHSLPKLLIATFFGISFVGAACAEEAPPSVPPPATSEETPAAPIESEAQKAASQKQDGDDKVICKKIDPPLGSRMGAKKICRTAADWRREREEAKDTVNDVQTTDTRGPPGS